MRSYQLLPIFLLPVLLVACGERQSSPGVGGDPKRDAPTSAPVAYDSNCVPPPPTRINPQVGWAEYDTVTAELIRCLPDTTLDRAIYLRASRSIAGLLNQGTNTGIADPYQAFTRLPPGLRMVWSTWGVEMETANGGFDQYLVNTSGRFMESAVEGLRLIGAERMASIAQGAYELWMAERRRMEAGGDATASGEERRRYFATADSLSREFNKAVASGDRQGSVAWLRVQYIRSHPEEFITK